MKYFSKYLFILYCLTFRSVMLLLFCSVSLGVVFRSMENWTALENYLNYSIILLCYLGIIFSLCLMHRVSCKTFKVYISFSTYRSRFWANFIASYLWRALWFYNISYYDFRKGKIFHELDSNAIFQEIDKNLSDSQIFVRFLDKGVQPTFKLTSQIWMHTIYNHFTRGFSDRHPNYYKYEVDTSYDEFGFIHEYNRFQIISSDVVAVPITKIRNIYYIYGESLLVFSIKIVNELIEGNEKRIYWQSRWRNRRYQGD